MHAKEKCSQTNFTRIPSSKTGAESGLDRDQATQARVTLAHGTTHYFNVNIARVESSVFPYKDLSRPRVDVNIVIGPVPSRGNSARNTGRRASQEGPINFPRTGREIDEKHGGIF